MFVQTSSSSCTLNILAFGIWASLLPSRGLACKYSLSASALLPAANSACRTSFGFSCELGLTVHGENGTEGPEEGRGQAQIRGEGGTASEGGTVYPASPVPSLGC